MFAFTFTAKDKQHAKVTDRVVATSIEDAYAQLEKAGYSEIDVLDSKETAIKLNDADSRRRLLMNAADARQLQSQTRLSIKIAMLFAHNTKNWGPLLVWWAIATALYGWRSTAALIPAVFFLIFVVWFFWAIVPMVLYNLALEASTWCRWAEAERIMRFFSRWKTCFKTPLPGHEIIFRLATAEAGQGRLAAGLERAAVLQNDSSLAPGFYEARLASVYFAAGDFQRAAVSQHAARKLNPGVPSTIDLATTLARRLDNPRGAERLLAEIEGAKLAQLQRIVYLYCQGVIALKTAQAAKAHDVLQEAHELISAHGGTPLMQIFVAEIRAHLALALCACNRQVEANPHAAAALPLLKARQEKTLLAQLDAALNN
ncbi:hypothetical protein [Undibacterium sp. TJN19]|uniref:hypothetical protein n=1 Tax=Undibacterium sp. TJN19 TaxID=3413055 RepID=UPI003BF16AB6